MIKYVLLTAARNEEAYIGATLQSVVEQSVLPQRWIIVDDGSTDHTESIIANYAEQHDFIRLISVAGDKRRNFGSKSKAIMYAYQQLSDVEFNYVGNLDADIGLPPDYYEQILNKLEANPRLGLAGGIRYDKKGKQFELVNCARNSVGGPIQLFRRECFENIGGYKPLPYGGIDAVAEITARMQGWEVRSFPEYRVYHYRATGTATNSVWRALYRGGIRDYTIGYHLLFQLARAFSRMRKRPYIVGGIFMFSGYMSGWLKRINRPVPAEMISFLHAEQMSRLRRALTRRGTVDSL